MEKYGNIGEHTPDIEQLPLADKDKLEKLAEDPTKRLADAAAKQCGSHCGCHDTPADGPAR